MTKIKKKHIKKRVAKKRKNSKKSGKRTVQSARYGEPKRFRFLAFQPISMNLYCREPFELYIQNIHCRLALWPVHTDKSMQRTHGGTFVAVEFLLTNEIDLLIAANKGLDLVNDFFSAVSIVEGTSLPEVKPVQIAFAEQALGNYNLLYFLDLSIRHWDKLVSKNTIDAIRGFLAHWDGLDSGKRLRRAAHHYYKAIGTNDVIALFQQAYMGMEALEKPLANAMNIPPGVEEIKGNCEKCGAEYTRRRNVLAGVRAYVCGELHSEMASNERNKEWKEINRLRHELFHSLEDSNKLEEEAHRVAPAVMHYLHDAICCLSHAHKLESSCFKLVRGTRQIVLVGRFRSDGLGSSEPWRPLLEIENGYWVKHHQHGFVPEFRITNTGIKDLEAAFFWLEKPLGSASQNDLIPANWEHNQTNSNL
jgi:hypothetical protein